MSTVRLLRFQFGGHRCQMRLRLLGIDIIVMIGLFVQCRRLRSDAHHVRRLGLRVRVCPTKARLANAPPMLLQGLCAADHHRGAGPAHAQWFGRQHREFVARRDGAGLGQPGFDSADRWQRARPPDGRQLVVRRLVRGVRVGMRMGGQVMLLLLLLLQQLLLLLLKESVIWPHQIDRGGTQ
jgi:hypothetical protein